MIKEELEDVQISKASVKTKAKAVLQSFVIGLILWFFFPHINSAISIDISAIFIGIYTLFTLATFRTFRFYLVLSSDYIKFRNMFRAVFLPIQDILKIEIIISTYTGKSGPRAGDLGDKVVFTTKKHNYSQKRTLHLLGFEDSCIAELKRFSSIHNIELCEIWNEKKGLDHF